MSRIVLTTIGSAGDLFPFLSIAHELRVRGHEVVFAANPWFEEPITHEGFSFVGLGRWLGPDEYAMWPEILEPRGGGLPALRTLMERFVLPHLEQVTRELHAAVGPGDLLLTHPAQLAAPMVAELAGVRWGTLSVFPGNLPGRDHPPQGMPRLPLPGALAARANEAGWALARRTMRSAFDPELNRIRQDLGLPPGRDLFLLSGLSPDLVLVLCPATYCAPSPDWPDQVRCVGYTLFDTPRDWQDPPGLAEFLDGGEAPVLVCLGVSVAMHAGEFVQQALDALGRAGSRGLFLVGRAPNVPARVPSGHAFFPYVPLSRVLDRVRLVLHPGGFGTTAAVVRAGLPSIVVPRAFDQAYHARRLVELGLGYKHGGARIRSGRLAAQIARASSDEELFRRCASFASRVAGDGTGVACDAIEETLLGVGGGSPAAPGQSGS